MSYPGYVTVQCSGDMHQYCYDQTWCTCQCHQTDWTGIWKKDRRNDLKDIAAAYIGSFAVVIIFGVMMWVIVKGWG